MFDALPTLTNFVTALERVPWWQIALEWLVIGAVVYWVIRFLQGTRGARVFKGVAVVLITLGLGVRLLGGVLDLTRLEVLFRQFLFYATFAILIVFQPELRRALMRLGETRLFRGRSSATDEIEQLAEACSTLSRRRVGALIAFERDVGLGSYAEEATRLDAEVSAPLLTTIFHPNTALHDLGAVIRNGRLAYAGVQFPLAESGDLPKELGSRHRAAVGLSQETDAVIVVVSEETGDVSIAERGVLHRKIGVDRMREMLHDFLGQSVPVDVRPVLKASPPSLRERTTLRDESLSGERPERRSRVSRSIDTIPRRLDSSPGDDDAPAPIREIKPVGASVGASVSGSVDAPVETRRKAAG